MITFKYKDKIITTPNLEKKLKRMHLTLDDIEIIDTPEKKKEDNELDIPLENYHYYKYPDENRWLLHITDTPEEEIIFNNQILERDIAYEKNNLRFLKDELRASRISL